MATKRKRVRDMSPAEQIAHYEDRRVFKALDKAAGIGDLMEISIQPCIFGQALIATSWKDRLIAVELGTTTEELMKNFINHWNTTKTARALRINQDSPDLRVVSDVLKVINQGGLLDRSTLQKMSLHGTMFQRQVWQALMEIPEGTTTTYKEVAEKSNNPNAIRAVANAIGANPIAIIVPCHRVIHTSGKTDGYRWGNAVKTRLLEREQI